MTEFILWIFAALPLLFFGAEWLVRGSALFGLRLGLTTLVIGLIVAPTVRTCCSWPPRGT